ncbi:MAG: hypothetical protein GX442_21310 [Candidatus Riflebacteria bacterium]|nr:hypothetical protein [Candidatus Riflebacteria bacterium]
MAFGLENGNDRRPAFQVRVVVEVPFDVAWLSGIPGWRLAPGDDHYGWFGKIHRRAWHSWGEDFLHWQGQSADALPHVFLLDLHFLKGCRVQGPADLPEAWLAGIDLVPLNWGKEPRRLGFRTSASSSAGAGPAHTALLGLILEGKPTTLRQYLSLISARAGLGRFTLSSPRTEQKKLAITIGGLILEVTTSLAERRRPDPARMAGARSAPEFRLCQVVHVPAGVYTDSPTDENFTDLVGPWELLATGSRPKPNYPKDPDSLMTWVHPRSPFTLYGLHDCGLSFLFGPSADGFNQTTKPRIAMEAHYLQWIQAMHATRTHRAYLPSIANTYTEALRRMYLKQCFEFFEPPLRKPEDQEDGQEPETKEFANRQSPKWSPPPDDEGE